MTSPNAVPAPGSKTSGSSRRRFIQETLGTLVATSVLAKLVDGEKLSAAEPAPIRTEPLVSKAASLPYLIGVAEADITPTWPVKMAGFAFRGDKLSAGVYQPLYTRAISIDDGKNKIVYLMADICFWDNRNRPEGIVEGIRAGLKNNHGLSPEQVVMVATHTHSGPVLSDAKFKPLLIEKAIQVVGDALKSARPARLFFGRGKTEIGIARRGRDVNGDGVWEINPYGSHDREIVVLKAVDHAGRPIALTFNYGCHPTTMGTQMIGGDYAGFAQLEMKKRLGGAPALFLQGTAGDAKPNNPDPDNRFLFLSPTKATVDQPEAFGKQLADDVSRVLAAPMNEITGPIRFGLVTTELPFLSAWKGNQMIETDANADPAKPLSGPRRRMARMARWTLDSMNENGEYHATQKSDIYVVRIGDAFIHVGISGEACSPIGLRLKDQLRGCEVMVTGYTGLMNGYIPGQSQLSAGGYEVFTNPRRLPYSPEAEDMLVCDAVNLVQTIGPKIPSLETKPPP